MSCTYKQVTSQSKLNQKGHLVTDFSLDVFKKLFSPTKKLIVSDLPTPVLPIRILVKSNEQTID